MHAEWRTTLQLLRGCNICDLAPQNGPKLALKYKVYFHIIFLAILPLMVQNMQGLQFSNLEIRFDYVHKIYLTLHF